jgi:hypothetical protein
MSKADAGEPPGKARHRVRISVRGEVGSIGAGAAGSAAGL